MYGIYVGIKKILPLTIFTIPTVGLSDVSLQQPTSTNTTIADHGCCRRKWAGINGPLAPHMRPCALGQHVKSMDDNPQGKQV